MGKHHKLSAIEREQIALLQTRGFSNKEIGRRLGRQTSTIGRELKRNGSTNCYSAIQAQSRAEQRACIVAHSKQELRNPDVYRYVTEYLRNGWSPDQIAGRIKKDYPNDTHWRISTETIYRWIYQTKQVKTGQ